MPGNKECVPLLWQEWQEWQQWQQWQVVLTVQYFPASGSFTGQGPSRPSLQRNVFSSRTLALIVP